jgi:DNA-binding response OmpR family regulator
VSQVRPDLIILDVQLPHTDGLEVCRQVHLTQTQFDLLHHLIQHAGVPCARNDILDAVWGYDKAGLEVSHRALDTHISRLRAQIEPDPSAPCYITSVYGLGYRFKEF